MIFNKNPNEVFKNGIYRESKKLIKIQYCEDAISRDRTIDLVQSYIHEIISESGRDLNAHTNRVLREIRDRIKDGLPSVKPQQKVGKWIPCSERLPEEDGLYLVIGLDIYFGEYSPFIFKREKTSPTNTIKWGDIVAWMSLPEPYKVSEHEMGIKV